MQHPKKGRNSDDIHSGRQLHPRSKLLNVLLTSAPLRSSWEIQTKAVLKSIAEMFPLCLNNRGLRERLARAASSLFLPLSRSMLQEQQRQTKGGHFLSDQNYFRINSFSIFLLNKFKKPSYPINTINWSFQKLLVYKYE